MISGPISSILSFPSRSGYHGAQEYIVPDQVRGEALSLFPSHDIDFVLRVYRWVRTHIIYTTDPAQFGRSEVFLFPRETVSLGKGDCEDISNLIASMLLAAFPVEDVRVAYGVQGKYNHAWTEVNIGGSWVYVDGTIEYPLSTSFSRPPTLFPEFYVYSAGVSR